MGHNGVHPLGASEPQDAVKIKLHRVYDKAEKQQNPDVSFGKADAENRR
jgi:hypothetical protein